MSGVENSRKAEEWADRFERFEGSSLTVARWCESERVSEPSFYYWRKKLRDVTERSRQETARPHDKTSGQRPRRVAPAGKRQGSFQAVQIGSSDGERVREEATTQHQVTTIHFGAGFRIELGGDLQVAELVMKQVLDACSDSLRRGDSPDGQPSGAAYSGGARRC